VCGEAAILKKYGSGVHKVMYTELLILMRLKEKGINSKLGKWLGSEMYFYIQAEVWS
jgi:hypothetical protein